MTNEDYEILCHMNGGKPPEFAVKLLEDICARTGLDWKARHVYLMQRGGKWQVTLSIDGFRSVGARHPDYAGQEGPYWVVKADGTWTDIPPDGAIYASKVGILRKGGVVTWGVAKFKDYAAGPMWTKFPSTMIAKCAEMLAWRKAFPDTFGGLYGQEEMEQSGRKKQSGAPETGEADEMEGKLPPKDLDAIQNSYILRLQKAKDLDEVLRTGKEIQAEERLGHMEKMSLHGEYTKAKAKYEKTKTQ